MKPAIRIDDYFYDLPEDRIAKYPLANRDDSKLLVNLDGSPRDCRFRDIADYLPSGSLMVFNETKVVPARLLFRRDSGALIEVFCLEPKEPADYQQAFATSESCIWKAIVGNARKWKGDTLSLYVEHIDNEEIKSIDLKADLIERDGNAFIVKFTWKGSESFSRVMEMCGKMPIPPYLNRDSQPIDATRYQTLYAKIEGSVAAPTAGLHFTDKELDAIDSKGIERVKLCLHVGAGTFLPVKSEYIADHSMHGEPFSVSKDFLCTLSRYAGKEIVAVGTTSIRSLESLYYLGVHCIERGEPGVVGQWEPYRDEGYSYTPAAAVNALIKYLENNNLNTITSRTNLIIVPSYEFKFVTYMVTNFHQPKSTLLLLIAAAVGDGWKQMYGFAMDNGYRFLSYGDSSLLKVQYKFNNPL
ncbi:MAG: S-adenosylmethionine:tRNA ribosyltransferase-isomerase [Bacteroidales bacterium]|nr:S-adenosylmethionine:tRNA ribosyltransferase-isomerase [Bacteroidales bacterium]